MNLQNMVNKPGRGRWKPGVFGRNAEAGGLGMESHNVFLIDLRLVPSTKFSGFVLRRWKTLLAKSCIARACGRVEVVDEMENNVEAES